MTINSVEGITLCSTPLKERSKIVKVYTAKEGVLSFVVNCAGKKNFELTSFCSPCVHSEIIYINKNRDLLSAQEVTIKNLYLSLRDSYIRIDAAIGIIKSILLSQLPGKPNLILFEMVKKFINKLLTANNPYSYMSSFQLKLLILEGVLSLNDKCSICKSKATWIIGGDHFCPNHIINNYGIEFEIHELKTLHFLARSRKFSEIDTVVIADNLKCKIQKLFSDISI